MYRWMSWMIAATLVAGCGVDDTSTDGEPVVVVFDDAEPTEAADENPPADGGTSDNDPAGETGEDTSKDPDVMDPAPVDDPMDPDPINPEPEPDPMDPEPEPDPMDPDPMDPEPQLTCLEYLDQNGVDYETWNYQTQYADGLECTLFDPIHVNSPINGIEYRYYNETSPDDSIPMSCPLAARLHQLGDLLKQFDVVEVEHLGTFNCRKIAGTNYLSMHGYGLAIDFYGFTDSSGTEYILERDWEHNTANPLTTKGQWLYDLGQRFHSDGYFNIVLTPNYNAGHDNHFHLDLTPNASYIGSYRSALSFGHDCGN